MNKYNYIVIEGNIGAGKTSLAYTLANDLRAKFVPEKFAENPFLSMFYENTERYAFQLELSFLATRYQQLKEEFSNRDMYNPFLISDYYFAKSLIFAGVTLRDDEYRLYRQLFNIIHQHLPIPDLYVFIHQPIQKLLENIKKRGRSYERTITAEYLKSLQEGYFSFFENNRHLKIIIIDASALDFVLNTKDYEIMKDLITNQNFKTGINRILF